MKVRSKHFAYYMYVKIITRCEDKNLITFYHQLDEEEKDEQHSIYHLHELLNMQEDIP